MKISMLHLWHSPKAVILLLLVLMTSVIGTVLAFEHLGGYIPCQLCLEQRQPWYAGIMLTLIAVGLSHWLERPIALHIIVAILWALMVYSLYLGVFHAGVEWNWWEGPGDCGVVSSGLAEDSSDFLTQLNETIPPSCNEAAGRFLGLSFAGWNVIASIAGIIISARAFQLLRR